ncbi:MFS transporter [Acidipropionibacterium acidipropionici]|uniref:MFS transporter n=1 Tax=Acidipropionibacterium acidipropionici TaxID=1748 RepID=UPI001C2F559D|nr:MFS transporter [Acidipropionibacterium acidipropionici]
MTRIQHARPRPSRATDDSGPGAAATGLGAAVPGLVVLALATFSALTTEMVPVGLLPTLSRAFGVATSVAGLLVSLYAGLVAVLSVPLTWATRRLPRKPLLMACLGSYALSNAICAAAPSFAAVGPGGPWQG